MSIYLDRKTWFFRYRDENGTQHSVRLARKDDRLASKKDVLKSAEYQAVAIGKKQPNAAEARFLVAGRECGFDLAMLRRMLTDKQSVAMSLAKFVDEVYWPYVERELRAKTASEYHGLWQRYRLSEEFAGLTVSGVQPKHIVGVLEKAAPTVSTRTLQHLKFLLSGIFVLAITKGLRETNPVANVKLPKAARGSRKTIAYELREVQAMLDLPFKLEVRAALATAAYAGLRQSELQGLEWADYDGEFLHVRRSIDRVSKKAHATKTMASADAVPVIEQLKEILDAYKAAGSTEGRIFNGKIESWTKHPIRSAIKRAGLRWTGWHGFRRGLATTLNDLGVPLLTIQAIMRHSSPEVTEQAYVKRLPKQSLAAMDEFERAVQSESRNVQ